jgi:hypothetical protein
MNLARFLIHETKRGKLKEGGSLKTPMVMKTSFHEDLEDFFVSDSKGNLIHRENAEGGVPSVFFPLHVEDEDSYQALMADRIFVRACEEGWGNVVMLSEFTDGDFGDFITYFEEYDLVMSQVFCGPAGFETLRKSGRLIHPSRTAPLDEELSLDQITALRDGYIEVGALHHRPVFFNPHLDPYVIFSAPPQAVGLVTRIVDFASVVVHNPERGIIIARLDDSIMTPEDTDENHDEEE